MWPAEPDRLRSRTDTWAGLLTAANRDSVRIDVLAGTSVGVKAVVLGLAQAYDGVELGGMRYMWLDLADINGDLLRVPFVDDKSVGTRRHLTSIGRLLAAVTSPVTGSH